MKGKPQPHFWIEKIGYLDNGPPGPGYICTIGAPRRRSVFVDQLKLCKATKFRLYSSEAF